MTSRLLRILLIPVVVSMPAPAMALLTFGAGAPLASNAADDGDTYNSDATIVSAGGGVWIAGWQASGGPSLFSRSTDDGRSWSPVFDFGAGDSPILACQDGTCLAYDGALHRSIDGGASWTPIAGPSGDVVGIANDGAGRWLAVVNDYGPMSTKHSSSLDDGVTWSAEALFVGEAHGDREPLLACDGDGNCMAIWTEHDGVGTSVVGSVTNDGGANWSPKTAVPAASIGGHQSAELTSDGNGSWMLAYEASGAIDRYWEAIVSSDLGQSWNPAVGFGGIVSTYPYPRVFNLHLRSRDGIWHASWSQYGDPLGGTIGKEGDIITSRSMDNGLTWTDPSALNTGAGKDVAARDWRHDIAYSDEGTAVMVWSSTNTWFDTIGIDEDIFFARSQDDCPLEPLVGCVAPSEPGASKISIKNVVGGADKLSWTWSRGGEVLPAAFGDPTTTTGYALCLYDASTGIEKLALEARAEPAAPCGLGICWASRGDGWRYGATASRHGALNSLILTPGAEGESSIRARAGGPNLAPPIQPLSLAQAVRVQLVNLETNACWEATFSAPSTNDAEVFKGRSD